VYKRDCLRNKKTFKKKMSEEDKKNAAVQILMNCLCKAYNVFVDPDDYDKTIYSCARAPKYKNVYFIKLCQECDLSKYCILARNKEHMHRGQSTRSYCVNTKTNKVMSNCFSTKCKERGGGRFVFQQQLTSSEDESEDESSKRKRQKL
jgi:hypothetical protein